MLGSHIQSSLLGQDVDIFSYDKDLDICNEKMVEEAFERIAPNVVINCAAYTAVDDCETNQDLAMTINGECLAWIARLSKKFDAVLVHFSTDYVFDGKKEAGYTEDDVPNPINVYGESKLLGEKMIQENCEKYFIVRTSWLFGELGGSSFVETMIRLGKEKTALSIVGDQHGRPTYTKDITHTVLDELLNNFDGTYADFGIYHITNTGDTTWFEFAKEIFRLSDIHIDIKEVTTEEFPRPARRPQYSILLNTKLDLDMRSWRDALEIYLDTRA